MSALVSVPQAVVRVQRWTTPQLLVHGRSLLFVLEALLLVAIVAGTQAHRAVLDHVGNDTAKGVMAAEQIRTELAEMDAAAVGELLAPNDSKASGDFDAHRVLATESMIDAAGSVAAKSLNHDALETLQVTTGTYERLVQEARDLQESGQAEMSMRYYRAAGIVMDGTLLPAAEELDKNNNDLLESRFESQSAWSLVARAAVLLLGLGTVLALVVAQVFLSRRMRRTLNPMLFGATLLTLAMTLVSFAAMTKAQSELRVAKEDAFASVRTLLRARSTAYEAKSEEGRYLLDPAHAQEAERDFQRRMDTLVHLPGKMTMDQLMAGLGSGGHVDGFTGLLADELNNITFDGEKDAAIGSVGALVEYQRIDGEMRRLARDGHTPEAIKLETGRQQGEGNWALEQLDSMLGQTRDINVREFDSAIASGFAAVQRVEPESAVVTLLAGLLIFFGLAPRIREYS